jgi:hypothetical protein
MPRPFVLREVVGEPREEQISGVWGKNFCQGFFGGFSLPILKTVGTVYFYV